MISKKIAGILDDPKRSIEERLLILITSIAIVALILVFIGGMFLNENPGELAVLCVSIAIVSAVVFLAYKTNRLHLGAVICSVIVVFLVIPFTFFTSGGINGGTPLWIVLASVFIIMTVRGKISYVILFAEFIVSGACYFIARRNPSLVIPHSDIVGYQDSFMSLTVVCFMVCLMFDFAIRVYDKERMRSEERRREIDELNRAQSQFFSSMSHEIRTPINSIIGLDEMILRDESISDESAECAKNIQAASQMLLEIINNILDMSKIESGRMELNSVEYDLGNLLSDIVGMIWIRAKEKGLEFHIDVDPNLPASLIGDDVRIKQILINILNNAVKYTKEGSVTLSIQAKQTDLNIEGSLPDSVDVIFTVTDTGTGIKKENIPQLFTAFKRVDSEENRYVEGTGLGLSIVKQFVLLMGGTIKVNSVYTQGSTFVVEIPQGIASGDRIGELDLESMHLMNHRVRYTQSYEAPEARVLVVDDNEMNLFVVSKLLSDTGAMVDTAESGEECLKKTYARHYDVIFLDHLMPEMDGIECLHRIRRQEGGKSRNSRVCAFTANTGNDIQSLFKQEGFDSYLSKPVNAEMLEMELRQLLPEDKIRLISEDDVLSKDISIWYRDHRKKLPVMITTDSVCDLPAELIRSKRLETLPYHVNTDQGVFLDGLETEARELISYMRENRGSVSSDSPGIGEYEAFFAKHLNEANNIIHISMMSGVGRGYSSATEAARAFENVTVVDSRQVSSGLGMVVLKALELAEQELSVEQILNELHLFKNRVHTSFLAENTSYLARGGIINPVITRISNALMLNPVPALVIKNGRFRVSRVWFGSREETYKKYIASALYDRNSVNRELLFITYAGIGEEELCDIEKEVRRLVPFRQVILQKASSVISVNSGPGTFGLIFAAK